MLHKSQQSYSLADWDGLRRLSTVPCPRFSWPEPPPVFEDNGDSESCRSCPFSLLSGQLGGAMPRADIKHALEAKKNVHTTVTLSCERLTRL